MLKCIVFIRIYSNDKDPSNTIDEFIRCMYLYQPKEIIYNSVDCHIYKNHIVISDIGSGVNFNRKGFRYLL